MPLKQNMSLEAILPPRGNSELEVARGFHEFESRVNACVAVFTTLNIP
jgi:hypothetical protein